VRQFGHLPRIMALKVQKKCASSWSFTKNRGFKSTKEICVKLVIYQESWL